MSKCQSLLLILYVILIDEYDNFTYTTQTQTQTHTHTRTN